MKLKTISIIATLILMMPAMLHAQRRGRNAKNTKADVVVEDPRISQMLASTQQVVFVDSMVVGKADFMSHIPLSAHSGRLAQSARGLGTFTNEMGDHRLTTVATQADTATLIVSSDFIANRWTEAVALEGIDTRQANYPFLMPDGVTLYFAQQSEKSIGGYDIFVTRFDSETGRFLKAENVGMPFSSEANDYLYAVDEFNQLGYFVTDRRQPAGKVCIYVFIPTETRRTYRSEAYSDEQLRSLARIGRIADTWGDGQARAEALARLQAARAARQQTATTARQQGHTELDTLRHQADVLAKALTLARNYYANASADEQLRLRNEILSSEQQLELLLLEIKKKEKLIPYEQ